jgi:hypothetical protein
MSKVCAICGNPSEKMYCSSKCTKQAWKKSPKHPSNKPKPEKIIKEKKPKLTAICQNIHCGKEFIVDRPAYLKRGQMKFCSHACSERKYVVNEDFFTHHTKHNEIYNVLGFLFASGKILSWGINEIQIHSTKKKLEWFKKVTKCTYPIKPAECIKDKSKIVLYKIKITCEKWTTYLEDLGLSIAYTKHEFPCMLPEYRKWFVEGYIQTPWRSKKTDTDIILEIESPNLAKGIKEVTNGELVTNNLGYTITLKDCIKK